MRRWAFGVLAVMASVDASAAGQTYTPLPRHTMAPEILGVIDESDPVDSQDRRYDEYLIELETRHTLWISAETADGSRIASVIQLYGPGGESPVAGSDDRGSSPSSGIDFTAFQPGTYRLRVLGGGGSMGRYILRIAADPKDEGGYEVDGAASTRPAPSRPPLERFIICPGHRRCPR